MAFYNSRPKGFPFVLVCILLLATDQVSKLFFARLPMCLDTTAYRLFCQFRNYGNYSNPTGKIGIFDLLPVEIGTLVITALSLFIWYRFFYLKDRLTLLSLGLLSSGIIGNFVDRLFRGYVIDGISMAMIGKPIIFNLADCYISAGVILLGIAFLNYTRLVGRQEKRGLFQLRTPHRVIASFIGGIIFISLSAMFFAFIFNESNRKLFSPKEFILVGGYIFTITALVTLSTLLFIHRTLGPLERLLEYVAKQDFSTKFEFRSNDLLGYLENKLEEIKQTRIEEKMTHSISYALDALEKAQAESANTAQSPPPPESKAKVD